MRECNNDACGWRGPESETSQMKHGYPSMLCPKCHETTEAAMPSAPHYHQQAAVAELMFRELRKGMMTTVTGRVIDSGADWVMIQQDWQGGVLQSSKRIDYHYDSMTVGAGVKLLPMIDFAALERRAMAFNKVHEWPIQTFSYDWLTPIEPALPQAFIDGRPKPSTILMEINRVSYAGDSQQAEPWRRPVRAARHPVSPVRGRGPRRERW